MLKLAQLVSSPYGEASLIRCTANDGVGGENCQWQFARKSFRFTAVP